MAAPSAPLRDFGIRPANYVANTAVSWPGRLQQIHAFFRARSPDEMLGTAAPWTSPWLPRGNEQNFWNAAWSLQIINTLS